MTKEIFVDRSGNRIRKHDLEDYDMVGFRYDDENDQIIWEYTRRTPAPVLGVALIIGCLGILLLVILIWAVIYFLI